MDSLALHVGTCAGLSMAYRSVADHGFDASNAEYLGQHVLFSADCCDSLLCSASIVIGGLCFLLFGTYSGKLLCYRVTHDDNSLVFEAQFDEQVHQVSCVKHNEVVVVLTLSKIHFLKFRALQQVLEIDDENIVSL